VHAAIRVCDQRGSPKAVIGKSIACTRADDRIGKTVTLVGIRLEGKLAIMVVTEIPLVIVRCLTAGLRYREGRP